MSIYKANEIHLIKRPSGLPSHSQLRVTATFHFIDRWVPLQSFPHQDAVQKGKLKIEL